MEAQIVYIFIIYQEVSETNTSRYT